MTAPAHSFHIHLLLPVVIIFTCLACNPSVPSQYPQLLDSRLRLELIASAPQVKTPIGLAIDSKDNIYFLESHTHSTPQDYKGPKFDRIKKGIDPNGDGIPESWVIFADSLNDGMNLAFSPEDVLFLVEKNKVLSFRDTNGDGRSDETLTLLRMDKPDDVYDHAGLLGITYSPDGWLYISRGNTGSQAWEIQGTDGTSIKGYGDGGNVFRCRPDGSQLEEIATGFWNPFDLKFTSDGRLLLTDNDPDSRGPNRLIEIVPGGDYGYQSLYGGSGIHPFLSWNGELPGTLPYAAGLGEAPTGMLNADFTNFPEDYTGNVLAAIWEEKRIVKIPMELRQSSVAGTVQVLIQGDSSFHPVAMASNSKGDIYITDWQIRHYPVHGEGRLWRLSGQKHKPMKNKEQVYENLKKTETPRFSHGQNLHSPADYKNVFLSDDVFLQTIARHQLAVSGNETVMMEMIEDEDADIRLQALLTLLKSPVLISRTRLLRLLEDENEDVRQMALIYTAKHSRMDMYNEVNAILYKGKITPALFETWLATIRHLQPAFTVPYLAQSEHYAKQIPRTLPPGFVLSIVKDNRVNAEIRATAILLLEKPESHVPDLLDVFAQANGTLKTALLQVFQKIPEEKVAQVLLKTACDQSAETADRAQAIVSLSWQPADFCEPLSAVLQEKNNQLTDVVVRYLCRCSDREKELIKLIADSGSSEIYQLCTGKINPENRPKSDADRAAFASQPGNPQKGKWIFFSQKAQCQNCHKVAGWGGDFGPDLSHVGSSKTVKQLITAVLNPSAEISPEWQGWFVTTAEGQTFYGRQIDVGLNNAELLNVNGEFVNYKNPKKYGMASASLMPEGLENMLTEEEFRDLITWLSSLK